MEEDIEDKGEGKAARCQVAATHGQKKNVARRAMNKARNDVEEEVYKKLIYKLAHERDEDSKDTKGKGGKDGGGRLVTEKGLY